MVEDIIIIGAGGFGREVEWLINRINKEETLFNLLGFLDDDTNKDLKNSKKIVLGKIDDIVKFSDEINVVVAIGNSRIREILVNKIKNIKKVKFPNIIDPTAIINRELIVGEGNIICANAIATTDIEINNFNIINLECTIGHDVIIKDFVTLYPNVNVSGNVVINECVEIGTGTQIIQQKTIGKRSIIGAGSVVIKDIEDNVTAVGVPTRILPKKEGN